MITQKDIGKMIDLLVSAYGEKAYPVDDEKKMAKTVNLWTVMFEDDDPLEVAVAVKDCIATLTFPPHIADIKSRIAQNRLAGQMTEMEAWNIISKAVEDADSKEKAQKLFDGFPKIIQRIVGNPAKLRSWRKVDDAEFETVIGSNVMRTYRTLAQREIGYHALPADIQEAESWKIAGTKTIALPEGDEPKKLGYEMPEWMTRKVSYDGRVEDFKRPVTERDLKILEKREQLKAERFLK